MTFQMPLIKIHWVKLRPGLKLQVGVEEWWLRMILVMMISEMIYFQIKENHLNFHFNKLVSKHEIQTNSIGDGTKFNF